jgi:hypothetical protein
VDHAIDMAVVCGDPEPQKAGRDFFVSVIRGPPVSPVRSVSATAACVRETKVFMKANPNELFFFNIIFYKYIVS